MSLFVNTSSLSLPSSVSDDSVSGFSNSRRGSFADSVFSQQSCSTDATLVSSTPDILAKPTPLVDVLSRQAQDVDCSLCKATINPLPVTIAPVTTTEGRAFPINGTRDLIIAHLNPLLAAVASKGRQLKIVGLLMSEDEGCAMYSKMTGVNCGKLQLEYEVRDMRSQRDMDVLRAEIRSLNEDMTVDGVIFYTPCFGIEQDKEIRSWISPRIDVEGFDPSYWYQATRTAPPLLSEITPTSLAHSPIYPCTPLAVARALQLQGLYDLSAPAGSRLSGKVMTVVNRSDTVGLPLASMFANEGAIVFSLDVDSVQVWETHDPSLGPCISYTALSRETIYSLSDTIISAVPFPKFKIPTSALKPGVIAINVASGMNNFEDDVRIRASRVVERMGSLTVMMLVLNALALRARSVLE